MKPFSKDCFLSLMIFIVCSFLSRQVILATEFHFPNSPQITIGQWERLEVKVTNNLSYADPYKDVQLNVIYIMPGGKEISFWGFYDGNQTWRFRFMPNVTGLWKYRATFSDGTPGLTGEFWVVKSDLPGMLTVNRSNPIWFSSSENQILVRGFHIGDRFFASNWPEEKRNAFLDWVKQNGYNFLTVASHYLNRYEEGRGKGWDTPKLWPLSAVEFQKMENILDNLAARQIYIYPFAGFFGKNSNYPTDPGEQEQYIRYTLARIGSYWNLVFNVAGPEPNLRKAWMQSSDVERLGRQIRDLDVFDHLLTVHNATGDDPYRDSDWSTFGTLQGPKTQNRKTLSDALLKNHSPAKPLLAQETLWPGNVYHPAYTDDDLRKNAYIIQMSATALVYGDFAGISSTGFSGTMELSDCKKNRHEIVNAVWNFFESIPYYNMQPRQDLVSIGYCLAWPHNEYLVYLENGGTVDVKIERGQYEVTWINARNTKDLRISNPTKTGIKLKAPDEGDWLLRLVRN